jgi:hypothetical protein
MNYATLLETPTFQGALEELDEMLVSGQDTFLDFEDETLEQPVKEGKWSRKEIIGHLIDSALNNVQRFTRAQIPAHLENGVLITVGYAQNDWVRLAKYNQRDRIAMMELWDTLNEHILDVIRDASPQSLAVPIKIGDSQPMSLEDVFISYVGHVKHHLAQLESR